MGQLERYGLYVLCVVIVLILGVAIWGGDTAPANGGPIKQLERPLATSAEQGAAMRSGGLDPAPQTASPDMDPLGEGDRFFEQVEDDDPGVAGLATVTEAVAKKAPSRVDEQVVTRSAQPPSKQAKKAETATTRRTYLVQKGDTMEKISKQVLGSIKHVDAIKKLNPKINPRKMRPGDVLMLPWRDGDAVSKKGPNLSAPKSEWREYTVKTGDSAYAISIAMYGNAKYANKILEANGIVNAKKMRPKTVIKIPPLN